MKRIAALFLAVLSLAGCSSKKSSEAPAPDEDGDAAVEEPVKEYTKDEFRRIDVPLQVEQRDTGIQLEELDLTSMDFGEQLPPCKKLDDPYNNANRFTGIITESGNSIISEYEYSYYLDGSDACKVRSEGGIIETTSYEYDGIRRLVSEAVSNGNVTTATYTYEYDDYSNRSMKLKIVLFNIIQLI